MAQKRTLRLLDITQAPAHLHLSYEVAGLRFGNTIWYEDVDFDDLAARFGRDQIRNICFHIAAFEINKLCSLKPAVIDWGPFADLATPSFKALWERIYRNVWAQWRFENDEPDYHGPAMTASEDFNTPAVIAGHAHTDRFLSFCGGGKDSLVAMKLLSDVGADFGTLAYSTSFYGLAKLQHRLIEKLIDNYGVKTRHRQWIFDDFLDSPVLELRPDLKVKTVTAAETPSSVFGALPYVLKHGYRYVSLAHERSADAPQVVWDKTGEPVNHQWGKSYEAESLINTYIQNVLVRDFSYFSILKPVYDVSIFAALRGSEHAVVHTHSCNIEKPWCRRCAKCLYVWLGYTAFLGPETVRGAFGDENLYDVKDNVFLFRQLVGLESQLPFECIGEADEAALFMTMARSKGYRGRAFDACAEAIKSLKMGEVLDRYLAVGLSDAGIPDTIREKLGDVLKNNALAARAYIRNLPDAG